MASLVDKTNGTVKENKKYELETEIYGPIYKTTLAKMMREDLVQKIQKSEITIHVLWNLILKEQKII